ncbi:type VI secretion system baseplate subunit TssF [Dyadobacter sp. CY261]|uniref:type VI secretion system baseplate subunit TssF n=1 Tax=Dyadobacter sp. CY261 TaxID=2907203 RepID=UPI001F2BCE83|nr:type VI secretion system baseplate subunit TssF [Dyadobacter sp. CY261]MCF0075101.1 type VI secretion system baseplate subunit TssF [Dyadobacter sp. CY261]
MYTDPKRYKTRENIRNEMIREIARLWQYDESELAVEGFDPLVGMLLGAFATGIEGVYHELDNAAGRIVARLASLLTPEVLTGPQPAHAVMKVGIVDPVFEITPDHSFNCSVMGKEIFFNPAGHYELYKARVSTLIIQSRIREMGSSPKEYFMNDSLPLDEAWIGLSLDEDLAEFHNLPFFFDWRNDPNRFLNLDRLSGLRMFSETDELRVTPGLVGSRAGDSAGADAYPVETHESMVARYYRNNFFSLSSRKLSGSEEVRLTRSKYPADITKLLSPEDLAKYFLTDLFWIKIKFPGSITPEAVSRVLIDLNAIPVMNRRSVSQAYELKPLFNVFPVRVDQGEQFLGMREVEAPSGALLSNVQQFSRDNANQYLLRQRGVSRFDERDATDMLTYMVDLLRDESAVFKAIGQSEIDTDVEEIRKRLERITNVLVKDNFPNWFLTTKTAERSGRIMLRYWSTRAEEANNIAFGMKLNRDRGNVAFTDDQVLLTTSLGGSRSLQGDDFLPVFKKAILSRGRLVTSEDYKAACFAELGDKIKKVEVKKGFSLGNYPFEGLQPALEIALTPNLEKPLTPEQWDERTKRLSVIFEEQSSGILPISITINGVR